MKSSRGQVKRATNARWKQLVAFGHWPNYAVGFWRRDAPVAFIVESGDPWIAASSIGTVGPFSLPVRRDLVAFPSRPLPSIGTVLYEPRTLAGARNCCRLRRFLSHGIRGKLKSRQVDGEKGQMENCEVCRWKLREAGRSEGREERAVLARRRGRLRFPVTVLVRRGKGKASGCLIPD